MAQWLVRLPALVGGLLDDWGLAADGKPRHGVRSLVLPVRTSDGEAVLKVSYLDEGSEHEHLALQHWHGDGAVRLLRADPRRGALLLERLGPGDLSEHWDLEACEVVGKLYGRLHIPAPPQLRTLSALVERWEERFAALPRNAPVPHRLVAQARALAAGFAGDPATDGVLVHGNLQYRTVLANPASADPVPAGGRQPWLAVAPRPLSGDPHFEVAPMLHHAWDQAVASGDARAAVRRRFHTIVDTAALDEERARDWVILQEVARAVDGLDRATPDRRHTHQQTTVHVTVAKAVQG